MNTFRIFYASPSDTGDELEAARRVVKDLNDTLAKELGVKFELVYHRSHARLAINKAGGQGAVDDQLDPPKSDILLGVFLHRFGSRTIDHKYDSGTQSEIENCIEHWKNHQSPEIMLFFGLSEKGFKHNNREHRNQKERIWKLRKKLDPIIYGVEFTDTVDFEDKLLQNLRLYLKDKVERVKETQKQCINILEKSIIFTANKPRQVADICLKMTERLMEKLEKLAKGEVITDASLDEQYTVASGVAEYYRNKAGSFTAWATSLDLPSAFYQGHRNYFEMQSHFSHWEDHSFRAFAELELKKLEKMLVSSFSKTETAKLAQLAPAKSRIAVVSKQRIIEELTATHQSETYLGFWLFNFWHATHHFGLKYYLYDDDAKSYQDDLSFCTSEDKNHTIDDFIVYGRECVFGRVDPNPDPETKRVTLRMLTSGDPTRKGNLIVIDNYRAFFKQTWGKLNCLSLGDLLHLPDVRKSGALASMKEQVEKLRQTLLGVLG